MFTSACRIRISTKTTKISPSEAPSAKLMTPRSTLQRFNSAEPNVAAPQSTAATPATRPTTFAQPVNHDQPGPPSFAAHQYGPPAVGYAEASSAMQNAMIRMIPQMIGQAHEIAIGPPLFHAWP